jgi:hypothetical protein
LPKIFLKAIKYCPHVFQTCLIWERYERSKFWDNKSPNFGTPTWESWNKVLFECAPMETQKIYYKDRSGASFQRLWDVWNLCLKLSLLGPPHHLCPTCINRLLFLVMQVDFILNFCLWICSSSILKL